MLGFRGDGVLASEAAKVTPSIKYLSRLTAPPSNFTRNVDLPISEGNNPREVYFHHMKTKRSQSYKYLNQDPIMGPSPE
jgi:hypothetical protein